MKEIVIKIPDYLYERICKVVDADIESYYMCQLDRAYMYKAICNGKELPKGHGELKDSQYIVNHIANTNFYLSADNWTELMKAIQDVETLVEADKGEEE